jgi:hypothetical protein
MLLFEWVQEKLLGAANDMRTSVGDRAGPPKQPTFRLVLKEPGARGKLATARARRVRAWG